MKISICTVGILSMLLFQGNLLAQEVAQVSDDPYQQSGAPPGASQTDENQAEDDNDSPFSWFTLSPQVGFSYFPEAELNVKGVTLKVESRKAFVGKLHFDLAGDGAALELVPMLAVEQTGDWDDMKVDTSSGFEGGLGGSFVALGGQVSLMYRGRAGHLFPHIGIGFHGARLISDDIDSGAELYGRIPLGFTVYMGNHLGFVMELGVMLGATGIRGKPVGNLDYLYNNYPELDKKTKIEDLTEDDIPSGMSKADIKKIVEAKIADEFKFGFGFAFDLTIGLRFP